MGASRDRLGGFRRLAVLAEGRLGVITSKTAACVIRYAPEKVACVIDSTRAGKVVGDVLGFGGDIPVVRNLRESLPYSPDSLLVGIAPRGGALPGEWRSILLEAIADGLNIASGLHHVLGEDPEIAGAARTAGVRIWDLRVPSLPNCVAKGSLRKKTGKVILTVGSDCSSGKMTVAYELARYLSGRGAPAEFVPTGQTGILLAGWGEAIDRVPGDFMSAVTETITEEALSRAPLAIVEGQGSLIHPAYSAVALGILHGCCPDAMVLCHQPSRTEIEEYGVEIPPLDELVGVYERAAALVYPSRVVAVALNTFDLDEASAERQAAEAGARTGLPVTDVIRWGCEGIAASLEGLL